MATVIANPEYRVSQNATSFFVKDITGAYDATDNPGGWGAPNRLLSQTALVCLVVRAASTGDELWAPKTPSVLYIYDNAALNSKETEFEIVYGMDGVLEISLVALRVSVDGTTYLDDASAIAEGAYFFYANTVNVMTSGVPTAVTDLTVLLDAAGMLFVTCNDIIAAKLAIKRQELRRDYTTQRNKACDDAEPLFQQGLKLAEDIRGAYYTFYSDLRVEAQNQIEQLIEDFDIE